MKHPVIGDVVAIISAVSIMENKYEMRSSEGGLKLKNCCGVNILLNLLHMLISLNTKRHDW